jgi:hypothetical protein
LKQFAYGGQNPPAPVSLQGFARKSLQSNSLASFVNCSNSKRSGFPYLDLTAISGNSKKLKQVVVQCRSLIRKRRYIK